MQQAISYRDAEGFVIEQDELFYRYLSVSYKESYDHLMRSGLYAHLVKRKLLIAHTEVSLTVEESKRFYKKLLPEQIDFISYPYEWAFEQWKEAVTTYLQICRSALDYGMILRDATPFNLTFYKGKCILFDTSSFGIYEENEPWIAYKQFCETMLGPLALIKYRGPEWITMMESKINGWDLAFISKHLPGLSYSNLSCLIHIHWHGVFANRASTTMRPVRKASFQKDKLIALWQMLLAAVSNWPPAKKKLSDWNKYYANQIEIETYIPEKSNIIKQWLQKTSPEVIADMGANTGKFSFIAASYAKLVIAVESDSKCIDQLFTEARKEQFTNIIPIVSDITQPAPGVGWDNEERIPLLKRLQCDMLFALAIIHHLRITKNVPLILIAKLFSKMTTDHLIVEFVPKTDTKVIQMLLNRQDTFDDYTEPGFINCFSHYFTLQETYAYSSSQRKLFLWVKK